MGLATEFMRMHNNEMSVRFGVIASSIIATPTRPPKQQPKQRKKHANEFEYETISEVLADLDRAFSSLSNKRLSHESKRLIKHIGLFMVDSDTHAINSSADMSSYGLPGVMPLIFNSKDDSGQHQGTTIIVFTKTKEVQAIEPLKKNAAMYEVEYLWTKQCKVGKKNNKLSRTNFFCEITNSGEVRQLRHFDTDTVSFKGKKGAVYIPKKEWVYQPTWSEENGGWKANRESGRKEASLLFNTVMGRETNVNVIVKNPAGYKIIFLVPMHRWKYFFKDRIDAMVGGKKRKIFHYVSAHTRQTKNKTVSVRNHTKGSRSFEWGKYHVDIVLPGKHGVALAEFGGTHEYMEDDELPDGYVDPGTAYKKISKVLGH